MADFNVNHITGKQGQQGTVLAGVTTVSSTGAMRIPSGPTEQRGGRGRGVFLAGYAAPSYYTSIDYVEIATTGNASDFGDLTVDKNYSGGCASATRGFSIGGWDEPGGTLLSGIEYVTISSKGGADDWGEMYESAYNVTGFSNSTRGLCAAGYGGPSSPLGPYMNVIQYFQMATQGSMSDFGNLVHKRRQHGSNGSSSTRGFVAGGQYNASGAASYVNMIDMITMTTLGEAIDFGDITADCDGTQSTSDATRLVISLGAGLSPLDWGLNIINYLTMATQGNASDFGDSTAKYTSSPTTSNSVRAVFAGGRDNPGYHNTIDYVTIQSTGNAADFGDLTSQRVVNAAAGDAHGGLGGD